MKHSMYVKRNVTKYYFTLPNQIFDLGLHYIEIAIYAYLLRIENRKTFECFASYPTIAQKLGLSVNTVAKYVAKLEEHGLIKTEYTRITTKAGLKRNGCLKYTILDIKKAINLYNDRQMLELQRTSDIEKAKKLAAKKGIDYKPPEGEQSAKLPAVGPCEPLCVAFTCEVGCRHHRSCGGTFLSHFQQICVGAKKSWRKRRARSGLRLGHFFPQCG